MFLILLPYVSLLYYVNFAPLNVLNLAPLHVFIMLR